MKLSIILPVYNVEKFIGDCLDSLLCQDLDKTEYEIICVDDGSPDNSYKVIEEYQKSNSNIRLIRQSNAGVSTARNNGLKEAIGEYVWYVDPDDYILPNCLGTILSAMDSFNADVCTFGYIEVDEQSIFKDVSEKEIKFTLNKDYSSTGSCYLHVVRREYLLKHKITLNKELGYGEDYLWSFQINYREHVGISTSENVYFYRQRQGSAMHSGLKEKQVKHMNNMISLAKVYESELVRCKEDKLPKKTIKNIVKRKNLCVQSAILDLIRLENDREKVKETLKQWKDFGLYPYRTMWWYLGAKELNKNFKARAFSLFLSKKWFVLLAHKSINKRR